MKQYDMQTVVLSEWQFHWSTRLVALMLDRPHREFRPRCCNVCAKMSSPPSSGVMNPKPWQVMAGDDKGPTFPIGLIVSETGPRISTSHPGSREAPSQRQISSTCHLAWLRYTNLYESFRRRGTGTTFTLDLFFPWADLVTSPSFQVKLPEPKGRVAKNCLEGYLVCIHSMIYLKHVDLIVIHILYICMNTLYKLIPFHSITWIHTHGVHDIYKLGVLQDLRQVSHMLL